MTSSPMAGNVKVKTPKEISLTAGLTLILMVILDMHVYPMTGEGEEWFIRHPHVNEDMTGSFQHIYDGDITVDDVYGYFDAGEDIFEM